MSAKNIRTMPPPSPASESNDHKSTAPYAKEGKDWNATNEVVEYVADNPPTGGPKGGQNAGL